MKRIRYLLRVLHGASIQKLTKIISRIHEQTGKNCVLLFADILICAVKYGAGYNDYLIFAFYEMTPKQRKTYVTRFINKRMISLLNKPSHECLFDRKTLFNDRFAAYLGRESFNVQHFGASEFLRFAQGKDAVFAKPDIGQCGKGIECFYLSAYDGPTDLYRVIKEGGFGVVEEAIVQHEVLAALYPFSVNTLRIVTLVSNGTPYPIYTVLKTGNAEEGAFRFVDNLESGGICAPVNMQTGVVMGIGHTAALTNLTHHPYSGIEFIGYQLPFVPEAVRLCLSAAMEVPEIRYVGWDVAITPEGPVIVEGNCHPGYDFWQLPEHTPNKTGLLPYYKSLLHDL